MARSATKLIKAIRKIRPPMPRTSHTIEELKEKFNGKKKGGKK
jgi:hypothetical protein